MLTRVLIAGRSGGTVRLLQTYLNDLPNAEVQIRVITNGHVDPLHDVPQTPDLVILHCDRAHTAELTAWTERPSQGRPALIVVGPGGAAEITRLAIRSGARDFLAEPVSKPEVMAAVLQVCLERRNEAAKGRGRLHVFVGATGGAGSSFIAANVAHMLAAHAHRRVALVDLDLNFSPTAHHLNLSSQRGLLEALDEVTSLDESALAGFGALHPSGLRLYFSTAKTAILSKDVPADRLSEFLSLLAGHYEDVVIDAPHIIDNLTATAFGTANEINIVLQQSTLHVRNALRLLRVLRDELAIAPSKLHLIVNRYAKSAALQLDDMSRTLGMELSVTVPSYYQRALESSDSGVPLYEADRGAAITAAMLNIVAQITGAMSDKPGLLRRALPAFLRK